MYKLVIADDDYQIRNGISLYFPWNEIGFEIVAQCENGMQVVTFMKDHAVDVLLCDIKMPIMSGIELVKELRERGELLKIIFLSSYQNFEYAREGMKYGVSNYIVKPTKYEELYEVFHSLKADIDKERMIRDHDGLLITANTGNNDDKIIEDIKRYIEQDYVAVTLESLASAIHFSPNYISKYFKEKTGQYYSDYIIQIKMEKAAELLLDMRNRTYQISELVGYSNSKNFTRTFKKFFGRTPREYRYHVTRKGYPL